MEKKNDASRTFLINNSCMRLTASPLRGSPTCWPVWLAPDTIYSPSSIFLWKSPENQSANTLRRNCARSVRAPLPILRVKVLSAASRASSLDSYDAVLPPYTRYAKPNNAISVIVFFTGIGCFFSSGQSTQLLGAFLVLFSIVLDG